MFGDVTTICQSPQYQFELDMRGNIQQKYDTTFL